MKPETCNNGHPFSDFCSSSCVWPKPAADLYHDARADLYRALDSNHSPALRDHLISAFETAVVARLEAS